MTLEQIISLTQAGFTKDDIFAMIDSNTNPHQPTATPTAQPSAMPQPPAAAPTSVAPVITPVQVPQQVQAPAPTLAPAPTSAWGFAPAPAPTSANAQAPVNAQVPTWGAQGVVQPMSENEKMINRLMESMNSLNSTMKKSNLMADVQPKAATTEDMLASIINPPEMSE